MNILVFIFIVIMHWIADFVFQTEIRSLGESKSWVLNNNSKTHTL